MHYAHEREVVLAAMQAATKVIAEHYQNYSGASSTSKGGHPLNLVTESDVAVEQGLIAALWDAFPHDSILGEESGSITNPALPAPSTPPRRQWVIDPICGTRNFAHGLPSVATNVALLIDRQPVLAVVGISPARHRDLLWAERGQGAYARLGDGSDSRLQASAATKIVQVDIGYALISRQSAPIAAILAALVASADYPVRVVGSSAALAYQACGDLAAGLFQQSRPWDVIAGCLLCEEAGALVTDFDGAPWDPFGSTFLTCSDATLQRRLLDIIAQSSSLLPALAAFSHRPANLSE